MSFMRLYPKRGGKKVPIIEFLSLITNAYPDIDDGHGAKMIYLEEYFATVLIYQEKNQAPVMILGRDDDVVKSAREELIKKLKIEF